MKNSLWFLVVALSALGGCQSGDEPNLGDGSETTEQVAQALPADGSLNHQETLTTTTAYTSISATPLTTVRLTRTEEGLSDDIWGARFVTAGRLSSGVLRVSMWRLSDDGTTVEHLASKDSTHSISGSSVGVARIDDVRFVVAARKSTGKLVVASFLVETDSSIVQMDDYVGSVNAADVSITGLNQSTGKLPFEGCCGSWEEGHAVVSFKTDGGDLRLQDFGVDEFGGVVDYGTVTESGLPGGEVVVVPGSQPVAAWRTRTPNSTEVGTTACSNTSDDDGDGYTNCDDWDCCSASACDGIGACRQGTVVSASRTTSGSLKLISWQVSTRGVLTRLASSTSETTEDFDIAPQSFRRVATVRATGANPVVTTWDVTATGTINEHDSYSAAVTPNRVRLAAGGGSRLFLEMTDAAGVGRLQTLEAIDELRALERIGLTGSYWANAGDLVSLSDDRAVLAVLDGNSKLAFKVYRDYNMPLIRGSYDVTAPNPPQPDNTGTFDFLPPLSLAGDSSIAVGEEFVLACGNGQTAIYDRAGNNLTGGAISHGSLFGSLVAPTVDGVDNEQSINRHLTFQYLCDGSKPYSTSAGNLNQCEGEFFDTRCTYDEITKRFMILSMLRSVPKEYIQRYVAVAVSRTADPRDGFNTAVTTDNKAHDNPMMATTGGMLVIAHQTDGVQKEFLQPTALAIDIAGIASGAQDVLVTKIARHQTGNVNGFKVAKSLGTKHVGALYRRDGSADRYRIWFYEEPSRGKMDLREATVAVSPTPGMSNAAPGTLFLESVPPVWAGKLYIPDQYTSGTQDRVRVNGVNVVVSYPTSGFDVSVGSVTSSTPSDCTSQDTHCRRPTLAVNKERAVMVYGWYDDLLQACSSCSSGYCKGTTCVSNPILPRIRYAEFDPALTELTKGTLKTGTDMVVGGDGTQTWNPNNQFCGASVDPLSDDSTWYIHTTTTAPATWSYVAGRKLF